MKPYLKCENISKQLLQRLQSTQDRAGTEVSEERAAGMTHVAKVPSSGYTRGSASGSHFPSPRLQHGLGVIIGARMFEDLRMANHAGRYGVVEETIVLGP